MNAENAWMWIISFGYLLFVLYMVIWYRVDNRKTVVIYDWKKEGDFEAHV